MKLTCRAMVVALALACGPAAAQTPEMPALFPEDAALVYKELVATYDGYIYSYYMANYPTEESANANWQRMQEPRGRMLRFDKFFKNMTLRSTYSFAFEPAVRERLAVLYNNERTGPVKVRNGWTIIELIGTKPAPVPTFEAVQGALANLVAAGALPSAEELRSNPSLRQRSYLNAVRSVDDLRALPAGSDVNARLSIGDTLLMRSLYLKRPDLTDALLGMGADPNRCARKQCPVTLAIYNEARSTAERLLVAGAKPDQNDPSLNILDGPLNAAAYVGDLEMARALVKAGANINGVGPETPLMVTSGKANRAMAEYLISAGADPFAVTKPGLQRTALDFARGSKNAEYVAWLEGQMRKKVAVSGAYAWQGWIEQDGRRQSLDTSSIRLKRAPFRIVVRTSHPDLFVSAGTDRRLFDLLKIADSNLRSTMTIGAEDNEGKSVHLVVHESQAGTEGWGGSQSWWHEPKESRFTAVTDTPQGREYAREVREITLFGKDPRPTELPIDKTTLPAIYLIVGTRIRMSFHTNDVFAPKTVELRFD